MTDSYLPEDSERAHLFLACAVFGALLADKSLRGRVTPEQFERIAARYAVQQLKGVGLDKDMTSVQAAMQRLFHVEWNGAKDGLPLDAMIERLRLLAERDEALADVAKLAASGREDTNDAIRAFLETWKQMRGE